MQLFLSPGTDSRMNATCMNYYWVLGQESEHDKHLQAKTNNLEIPVPVQNEQYSLTANRGVSPEDS